MRAKVLLQLEQGTLPDVEFNIVLVPLFQFENFSFINCSVKQIGKRKQKISSA